jgi:hypothetical protein
LTELIVAVSETAYDFEIWVGHDRANRSATDIPSSPLNDAIGHGRLRNNILNKRRPDSITVARDRARVHICFLTGP